MNEDKLIVAFMVVICIAVLALTVAAVIAALKL